MLPMKAGRPSLCVKDSVGQAELNLHLVDDRSEYQFVGHQRSGIHFLIAADVEDEFTVVIAQRRSST